MSSKSDQELRDKLAGQCVTHASAESAFKTGWDAARANDMEKDQLREEVERLKGLKTITDLAKTITGHDPTDIAHQISETNQLREEVERLKSMDSILEMKRSADKMIELSGERDQLREEVERLRTENIRLVHEKAAIAGVHMRDLPEYLELKAMAERLAESLQVALTLADKDLLTYDRQREFWREALAEWASYKEGK